MISILSRTGATTRTDVGEPERFVVVVLQKIGVRPAAGLLMTATDHAKAHTPEDTYERGST